MDDNLAGYLLGSLDETAARQLEAQLQTNPEMRGRLALLKQALAPLAADRDEFVPPPGLAGRTLARIAATAGRDLPQAPRESAVAARGSWWRRADVVVAAGLLLLVAG